MRAVFFLPLLLALAACAGTSITDAATALKDDKANVCLHVENAFPPFANNFTLVRMGDATGTAPACTSK